MRTSRRFWSFISVVALACFAASCASSDSIESGQKFGVRMKGSYFVAVVLEEAARK